MKKIVLFVLVLAAVAATFPVRAVRTDQYPEFYYESEGALEHPSIPFYIWYAYKYVHPIKTAPASEVKFFKEQQLDFGKNFAQAQIESHAKIVAVGDMMVVTKMTAKNSEHIFDDIAGEIKNADIAFGNLEGPADPHRKVSDFPRYNYNREIVEAYKRVGFDIVSTANNHSLDQGPEGLVATLDYLDQLGLKHVGTSRNAAERAKAIPILAANGIKFAFLSYTFGTNGRKIPADKPWLVNKVDFNVIGKEPDLGLVKKDIETARKLGADIVIVVPHWDLEYEFYPPERFIPRAHAIIEMGADIILGYHPHCLQPMEKYVPKNPDRRGLPEAFIIYSLGNFIPDHPQTDFRTSVVLGLEIARGKVAGRDRMWIDKIELTPIMFQSGKDYRLVRVDKALAHRSDPEYSQLQPADFKKLEQAQNLINSLFLPAGKSIESFRP